MIAAVVLAAGLARRMGEQKLLLDLRGRPLYDWALRQGLSPVFGHRLVVTNREEIARAARALGYQTAESPNAARGMGFSVAAGVRALPETVQAAVFLNADQPFVPDALLRALADTWRQKGGIVVPVCEGKYRAPVLFDRRFFGELAALQGEQGGRQVYRAHMEAVNTLSWQENTAFLDLDTPEDYRKLNR